MKREITTKISMLASLILILVLLSKLNNFDFIIQAVLLTGLIVLSSLALALDKSKEQTIMQTLFFSAVIANSNYFYFKNPTLLVPLLTLIASIGLVITLTEKKKSLVLPPQLPELPENLEVETTITEPAYIVENYKPSKLQVYNARKKTAKKTVKRKATKKKVVKKTVSKTYKPGKYVASTGSNVYHSPKCYWAKKIVKQRRTWFDTEAQAQRHGFKKHSCLKKK
ncbi:hypothetical protein GOV04_02780 [Candidatus Woesearchaeota archaeon]|nr:hypothetical protein [Candidatus Woesearchaeota archaeon]